MNDEQLISTIHNEVSTLQDRFDKHLEIYASNGKESKRVADSLDILIAQNNEMYTVFRDMKGGMSVTKWVFGALAAVGGLWVIWIKVKNG